MIVLLMALAGTAAEPAAAEPAAPTPVAAEEVVVWGDAPRKAAREGVERALEADGYQLRRTRDGKDIFIAPQPYKPKVVVDRDGWVVMRRRGPVWVGADGRDDATSNKAHDAWCVLFPPACISLMGLQISRNKLDGERAEAFLAMQGALADYRSVLIEEGHRDRLAGALPAELDRLWVEGIAQGKRPIVQPLARREAIIELWLTRVDDSYGDAARRVIEHYIADHIQGTEWALSVAEMAAIDDRRTGRRPFQLPGHAPPAPGAPTEPPLAVRVAPSKPDPTPSPGPPIAGVVGPPVPGRLLPGLSTPLPTDMAGALALPPLKAAPTFLQWLRGDESDAVQATSAQGDLLDPDPAPGLTD
ncbi:MAG: hypothetical protein ACI8PZ_001702 [Myxococcota bacterium]|jgi:hypothetical protein